MKRFLIISAAMLGLTAPAFAQQKETFKEHLQNHYKVYGFIRNYFAYDNREGTAGTGDLFYWTPKDENWNYTETEAKLLGVERQDLNAQSQFRFLALTSRVGLDVSGYKIEGMEFGAKVEADFYAGLTGSTGTAQLRLRQAFATIKWADLGKKKNMSAVLKVGQAWHPMAADMPDIYSLETGAPFGPFSRTPLVQADYNFGKNFSLTAAAIWQMQYTSMGPKWDGTKYTPTASADYIKYGIVPEFYLGANVKAGGFLGRVGVDVVTIKPRNYDPVLKVKVNDRFSTANLFVYGQYKKDLFTAKAKTVYGGAGEHFNLMSGYARLADGNTETPDWTYGAMRASSTWVSLSYGKKVVGSLFGGFIQNFGTAKEISSTNDIYFQKSGAKNIGRMFRIEPEVTYNIGKFTVGLEYMLTGAQYGNYLPSEGDDAAAVLDAAKHGLALGNLHWVMNHRIQTMVKFTF